MRGHLGLKLNNLVIRKGEKGIKKKEKYMSIYLEL